MILRTILFVLYLIFFLYILIHSQFSLRFTFLFPLITPLFLLTILGKEFRAVKDWSVFYLLIFVYDSFRSVAPLINPQVNQTLLAELEIYIFNGSIPTIFLQHNFNLMLEGHLGTILTFFYMTHFILPVLVLYFLWRKNRQWYFFAISSLLLLSFLAFITFLIFPASPPWHASLNGVIPEVKQYLFINMDKIFSTNYLSDLYRSLNSNPYAPFPSLHSAYPALLFLLSAKYYRKYSIFFLVIAIIVPFTLVAFAEHYVVDVIGGWLYTAISYSIVNKFSRHKVVLKLTNSLH